MNANEFVKKFGWEYAKHILTDDAPLVMDLNYTNLKRLVESHELVGRFGGLEDATKVCIQLHCKGEGTSKLKQAIADVESCMEVNQ